MVEVKPEYQAAGEEEQAHFGNRNSVEGAALGERAIYPEPRTYKFPRREIFLSQGIVGEVGRRLASAGVHLDGDMAGEVLEKHKIRLSRVAQEQASGQLRALLREAAESRLDTLDNFVVVAFVIEREALRMTLA